MLGKRLWIWSFLKSVGSWILGMNKPLPKIKICFCKAETASLFTFPPSPPNRVVVLNIYRDLYTV